MRLLNHILFISIAYSVFAKLRISKDSRMFQDEQGRTRIFHGVNVVYKVPPYIPVLDKFDPSLSLSLEDIKYLKQFGLNLVRLGVIWEAIETAPGVYDSNLLERLVNLVNLLGEYGIYTIVDAHQDVFTRALCGEGVPHFYVEQLDYEKECKSIFARLLHLTNVCKGIKEYNYRTDEFNRPLIEECVKGNFMWYHTSPDLTSLYSKFYKNENGLLDKFASFWKVVAYGFKENPYVIGYDLWNEPWPGDFYNNLSHWIPGRSDNEEILPMYRKLDKAIREVDENYVMMFEPTPFPDIVPFFGGLVTGGFKEAPLNSTYNDRQMLNMHSYCCQASGSMCATGEPPLEAAETCRKHHFNKLKFMSDWSKRFNMSSILTEFGACKDSESCYNEISSVADAADKYLISWTYWMYKPYYDFTTSCSDNAEGLFNSDGSQQMWKIKALTRTYIQAFQGVPIKQSFNTKTKVFKAEFLVNKSIDFPSDLYYNKDLNYNSSFKLFVNSTDIVNVDNSTDFLLRFKISSNSSNPGENISPVITILAPGIEFNVSVLNHTGFIADEEITVLDEEKPNSVMSFNVTDLGVYSDKNAITVKINSNKAYSLLKASYLDGEDEFNLALNKDETYKFNDKSQLYIEKLRVKIQVENTIYSVEIRNMLKHNVIINVH